MHRARGVWLVALVVPALLGCGSDTANGVDTGAPSEATSTTQPTGATPQDPPDGSAEPTTTAPSPDDQPGPPLLITVDGRDLVALELASGDAVVLARGDELSDALGLTEGRFDDVDLSPDGVTVAFTFGGSIRDRLAYGLYEVPADGSAPPQRVSLDGGDAYVSSPRYSPDGRFLAVNSGGGLLVLDEGRNTTGEGIQMAYAPLHVTWAPDGDALVWLVHFERTDCCTRQSVSIDPATGQMTNEPIREPTDGSPYFDADGDLRSMPTRFSFDVDHSGRFVVASDGTPGQLLWWEINGDDPVPRPLPVDLDLTEAPPVAW